MKRVFGLLMAAPLLLSCAKGGSTVSVEEIASQRYVLESVNGEAFTNPERTPEIAFDAAMRVSGQVCNRFMGQGTLKNGVLTVQEMASTMMLCADPRLNALEADLAQQLRNGMQLRLDGGTLTLQNGETRYVYVREP